MTLNSRTVWILFGVILFLGGALRLVRLNAVPPGFFRDEADKGYSAYSLLETGRDTEGRLWPLQIRSLRIYTSPIYQWAAIPFVALGGLNETAVRLPAALVGTLTIVAVFLLGRRMLGDVEALIAALLLAVSPWHLPMSRWANQGIFVPFFLSLAVYLYWRFPLTPTLSQGRASQNAPLPKGGRGDHSSGIAAGILFFCAFFAYAPAKVFVPLFLMLLTLVCVRHAGWRWKAGRADVWLSFLALALPFAAYLGLSWDEAGSRFGAISILAPGEGWNDTVGAFVGGYLKHLDPAFLFLFGDRNPRHSVGGWGQLYHIEICTFLLGLLRVVKRHSLPDRVLLIWFLAALVPPALTREGLPHALRSVAAIPAVVLLSASGLVYLWELTGPMWDRSGWRRMPAIGIGLIIIAESLGFLATYFGKYPLRSYPYWEYGYREAIHAIEQHREPDELVYVRPISDYAEIHFLFYGKYPPDKYQAEQSIEKVTFLSGPSDVPGGPAIGPGLALILAYETVRGVPLDTVTGPDGRPLWRLVRIPASPAEPLKINP